MRTPASLVNVRRFGVLVALVLGFFLLGTGNASAHVVPWTTIQLSVQDGRTLAEVDVPLDDIEAATGINLGGQSQQDIDAHATQINAYLKKHFAPMSDGGRTWTVRTGPLSVVQAGDAESTGLYRQLVTTITLTPPSGDDGRSFELGYDAVVEKVVTHVVVVTVKSDWAAGNDSSYELGTLEVDTTTGAVPTFHVNLDEGSNLRGFVSMVTLGVRHIDEGTDHQLFLLALLVPAPLLAARGRWQGPAGVGRSVRRITRITLAFTLGHSVTLALGTLGLPVPQAPVEASIAVTIVVAAAHAIRPIFPGREALVAGSFGLVHGLAFAETLRELDLSGTRLVLSLLGFNLGIELMQLLVVTLVLPPLVVLAGAGKYRALRLVAAGIAGLAAMGWFAARVGYSNPISDAADQLGELSLIVITTLWIVAATFAAWAFTQKLRACGGPSRAFVGSRS